ncbi:MAG: phosphohistidine phosphatase SixA [Deltaproteobacteria bacterium]|nr:MAG: phosphohistidine phosphatase SixA [Deltaproteobacteria bacterium]
MKVILVRHGEAELAPDGEKHLSEKGKEQVHSLAKQLSKLNLSVEEIYQSGKPRALETCQILVEHLFPGHQILKSDDLEPGSDPSIWGELLGSYEKNIMLVGHLPYMSELVAYLLGPDKYMEFKPSDAVCLEKDGPSMWNLIWQKGP